MPRDSKVGRPSELSRYRSRQIGSPPYLAYPVICGNCFTFGGVKVNTRSQVLNADGEVIPGLYAAADVKGEVAGADNNAGLTILAECLNGPEELGHHAQARSGSFGRPCWLRAADTGR
jgi:tricarballylate dehydrogenase